MKNEIKQQYIYRVIKIDTPKSPSDKLVYDWVITSKLTEKEMSILVNDLLRILNDKDIKAIEYTKLQLSNQIYKTIRVKGKEDE